MKILSNETRRLFTVILGPNVDKWKQAIEAAKRLRNANASKCKKTQKEEYDALMLCLLAILQDHKKDA